MPKRLGPEARIVVLFEALPDESKRIVMDMLKSKQPVVKRGKSVPPAGKRSKQKPDVRLLAQEIEDEIESAFIAKRGSEAAAGN